MSKIFKKNKRESINYEDIENSEMLKWNKLIFRDEKSNKFWRISQNNNIVLINYGRINTKGIYHQKIFSQKEELEKFIENEIFKKLNKGYIKNIKFLNDRFNTIFEYEKYDDVMSENYKDLENNPKKLKSLWDCSELMRDYDIWNKEEMQEFIETRLDNLKMGKKKKSNLKRHLNKCIKNID